MKVTMVMVSSVNGKITNGDNPDIYEWTSDEDQKLFFSLKKTYRLIIMGRKTYQEIRDTIDRKEDKLRIVITKNPDAYKKETIPGKLEFSNESPKALIEGLATRGYQQALLVGGGEINGLFLEAHVVREIHLSIEPYILGNGKNLVEGIDGTTRLHLVSVKKLNTAGTLHVIYKIL